MENKNIINMKRKIHELSTQHNKLTLLCKMLYSNLKRLNSEVASLRGPSGRSQNRSVSNQQNLETVLGPPQILFVPRILGNNPVG